MKSPSGKANGWWLVVALLATACSGGERRGIPTRVAASTCRLGGLPSLGVERAFPNLRFSSPVLLTYPPDGTNRLFVVEQGGRIRVFENREDATQTGLFLDISGRLRSGGEQGLLALAFHPDYRNNGTFFVYYTQGSPSPAILARYRASADPNVADPASEEVLLEVPQPFSNHNGGTLAFGPDGMLYLSTGDGGSGGDPRNNGQNTNSLLGKVLRIDVDRTVGTVPYGIPPDNPLVGQNDVRAEIWAWGLRNPWRCSFDRQSGDLWCGDVGQSQWEEIDIIRRGGNYGWRLMEGEACYNPDTGCNDGSLTLPVAVYSHAEGCSVTGGYVYRGSRLSDLQGAYLYADYCSGRIWGLRHDGRTTTENRVLVDSSGLNITSFGEDQAGEVYIVHGQGTLHRLAAPAGGASGPIPQRLSETGCYADLGLREPAPGLIPYDVNAPLWADGTLKRRFLVLPGITTIGFRETGAWELPNGTILIKEFLLETRAGDASSRRALETRFLVKREEGWQGYTFEWNAEQTDGVLLGDAATRTYDVTDAQGTATQYTHYFPSGADCVRCHTAAAGNVLGLRTGQMNRNHDYGGIIDNQLAAWEHIGLFGGALPRRPAALPRYPEPTDASVPFEARARAYLQGNCAHCHLPQGPTPSMLDLRYETALSEMALCGVSPTSGDLGIAGALLLKPGDPDASLLWLRVARRDTSQMPPLATSRVDADASSLIRSWISSLAGCP